MTELLLVSCVVSGLVMMVPAIRPALCPTSNENEAESTVEQRVPNLVVARLCNEAWFQSGTSKLIRCDLENQQNELAYLAPDNSIINEWHVSDDGCTLLVSTLTQAGEFEQIVTIYRGEEILVRQMYPQSSKRSALLDLAADGMSAISVSQGKQIQLWDLHSAESVVSNFTLECDAKIVRLDTANKRIVAITEQGPIQVYDLCTKRRTQTLELPATDNNPKHSAVSRLAVSHNGQFMVIGMIDILAVFDFNKGEWIWKKQFAEDYSVIELAISADDRLIACSGLSANLIVCNTSSGECTHELVSPPDSLSRDVHRIGFAASNDRVYSASFGSTVFEWDLTTFQRRAITPDTMPSIL